MSEVNDPQYLSFNCQLEKLVKRIVKDGKKMCNTKEKLDKQTQSTNSTWCTSILCQLPQNTKYPFFQHSQWHQKFGRCREAQEGLDRTC